MNCPKCTFEIEKQQVNIQADIAQCTNCEAIFKISEHITGYLDNTFNINDTPNGTWTFNEFNKTIIGASTRSPIAFFLVPFMFIWSGFSLGGIYGTQIISGEFQLIPSLFGIPFLIGSIIFWSFALMAIWGKVELTLDNRGGKIFTGVGTMGLIKKFSWNEITLIKEDQTTVRYPGSRGKSIIFEGKSRLSFGSGLKEERLYYLLKASQFVMNKYR